MTWETHIKALRVEYASMRVRPRVFATDDGFGAAAAAAVAAMDSPFPKKGVPRLPTNNLLETFLLSDVDLK